MLLCTSLSIFHSTEFLLIPFRSYRMKLRFRTVIMVADSFIVTLLVLPVTSSLFHAHDVIASGPIPNFN
jgi:hypothetical protein